MISMYGRRLKQWLTTGRAVALVVALVGLGLLAGGATGALGSRDSESAPAATAEQTVPTVHENTATAAPREHQGEASSQIAAPPLPLATSEPEPRIALAPVPDRDRPSRRLAELSLAPPPARAARIEARDHAASDQGNEDAAWRRFAAAAPMIDGPMIAIVIDDSGHDIARTQRIAAFSSGVLTMAFLPYVNNLAEQTAIARQGGHEILLHLPMEPLNPELDTGPNVLTIDMTPAVLDERLQWNLARLEGYVGINNHMGSRFTADRPAMAHFMRTLQARGLLFLDSRTTTATVGKQTAAEAHVPYLRRDVFLDNEANKDHVLGQLLLTEEVARRQGYAIAIGHPHTWTVDALETWGPEARRRGFSLVPLTAILQYRQQEVAQRPSQH
ncbi:MAG: divergent polysaccharide deacetylase family protein [Alphaproteobacteria bacterium]|nr:divergent polysaccharide deacetylase family protein [Alphaproteobacteria bacterium]